MKLTFNQQIIGGSVLGVLLGIYLNRLSPADPLKTSLLYGCDIIGGIFINLLKMILIPLVFTSIAVGITNLRAHAQMSRVWKLTILFFSFTLILAVSLGLFSVNLVQPGKGLDIASFQESMQSFQGQKMTLAEFVKTFLNQLFQNPVASMAEGAVLPVLIFAIFFGIALIILGEKAQTLIHILNEFFQAIMVMVNWIMRLLPLGLLALLSKLIATQEMSILLSLGKFMALVVVATLFHGFIVLPVILFFLTRMNPLTFFVGAKDALITALSTSSSNATMPVTLRCVKENLKVDKDIAGFVVPLGAIVNMDGTALYEAVAALFVANLVGVELNFFQQIIVCLTSMIAAIGAPGIPSAGMVTMIMVLQAVGLPIEAIAILIPIDRPLDSIRTMVNVEGDLIGSVVVNHHTLNRR